MIRVVLLLVALMVAGCGYEKGDCVYLTIGSYGLATKVEYYGYSEYSHFYIDGNGAINSVAVSESSFIGCAE